MREGEENDTHHNRLDVRAPRESLECLERGREGGRGEEREEGERERVGHS